MHGDGENDGRSRLEGNRDQAFQVGYAEFEIPTRNPNGDIRLQNVSLEV